MGKVNLSIAAVSRAQAQSAPDAKRRQKECLVVDLQSHYRQMRDSQGIALTRAILRDMLYAFARPLVPHWDESELYESVDEFLDGMEL